MARRRGSKRVCAIPRAPDGSAFFNCEKCGVSVAICLSDMHSCESNKIPVQFFQQDLTLELYDLPRSAYRLFMESFTKGKEMESYIEIERLGFEKWQNMSELDKLPFVSHAELLDLFHQQKLELEALQIIKISDGAESPLVENLNKPQGTLENLQRTRKHNFIYTDHGVYFGGYLVVNYNKRR